LINLIFRDAKGIEVVSNDGGLWKLARLHGIRSKGNRSAQAAKEEVPFPSYNDFDTIDRFVKKADEGVFARLLRKQLPANSKVVEIGCGTGQLSNYLAATTGSSVYATDMTHASLRLGNDFARRNGIGRVRFIQMNLFKPALTCERTYRPPDARRGFAIAVGLPVVAWHPGCAAETFRFDAQAFCIVERYVANRA